MLHIFFIANLLSALPCFYRAVSSFYLLFHILLHQQDQIGQLYLTVFIHIGIELVDLDRDAGQVFFELQDVQQAAGLAVIIYIA